MTMSFRQIILNKPRRKKSVGTVDWQEAEDIRERVHLLVIRLQMNWIDPERVFCFRSQKSVARAYARIWGLSTIWQKALKTDAAYCIEVLSEKFDRESMRKQDEILIHELCHIPHTFSGSLLPHTRRGKNSFHDRVDTLVAMYKKQNR